MPETFFRPELFEFLRQLKRHNNREWFNRNKPRYLEFAQEPALHFITSFAEPLAALSPHMVADARPTRGSLFRIYRDTRFSDDKRPYKTHIGIQFSHEAGKDAHAPCYYLHLEPDSCFIAAGVWHPDTSVLTRIRTAIAAQPELWAKATRKLELEGESLLRPPRGFDPAHKFIADLKRKDYIASEPLTEAQICSPKLMRDVTSACRKMTPLVEFAAKALGLKY
jgi:uncharacterized protein (TIGR02453 family)